MFLHGLRLLAAVFVVCGGFVTAQPPLPGGRQEALPRLPNDNIEGAVWQYRATRKGSDEELTGRFRVDEQVVFDLGRDVEIPDRPRDGGPLKKIIEGEGGTIRLPEEPQQKRIGECKTLSTGDVRIDFQPETPLQGYVIVRPKKDATGVWWGTYQAVAEKKNGLRWNIELRKAED